MVNSSSKELSFNVDEHQLNWVTSVIFFNEKPRILRICSYSSVNRYESRFRFLQQLKSMSAFILVLAI